MCGGRWEQSVTRRSYANTRCSDAASAPIAGSGSREEMRVTQLLSFASRMHVVCCYACYSACFLSNTLSNAGFSCDFCCTALLLRSLLSVGSFMHSILLSLLLSMRIPFLLTFEDLLHLPLLPPSSGRPCDFRLFPSPHSLILEM